MPGKRDPHNNPTENEAEKESDIEELYQLPVDRGWAWVILAASFMNMTLAIGYFRSFGILFVEFLNQYKASASVTSLIMGLQGATISIAGFLTQTILMSLLSERTIVTMGGLLTGCGVIGSVFATNIPILIFTQSIIVGVGVSMVIGPGVVILNTYFKKWRSKAVAASAIGTNLGSIVFPLFMRYVLDEFGFKGAFLITGAVMLHIMLGGMLYRPFTFYENIQKKKKDLLLGNQELNDVKLEEMLPKPSELSELDSDCRARCYSDSHIIRRDSDIHSIYYSFPDLFTSSYSCINERHASRSCRNDSCVHDTNIRYSNAKLHESSQYTKCLSMFDFFLFKKPLFLIMISSAVFGICVSVVMNAFLPALAISKGVSPTNAALLLSIAAAIGILGRVCIGVLADLKIMKLNHIMAISLTISGVSGLLAPLYNGFSAMICFSVVYGFFGGLYSTLISVLLVEYLGLEQLSTAYGFLTVANGISLSLVYPLAGWMRDMTGTFDSSYLLFGSFGLVAAGILLLEPLARK